MGLVDLRTDLKSLRFGKDRVGGGSSNQPYKTRPIPDSLSDTDVTGGPDFLLRGGTLSLRNSVRDISRLTQMFFDLKSPNGLLFTAKQQLLSRSSVKTQASPEGFNEGIYLPTSTIAQAAVQGKGVHLYKQGIIPTKTSDKDSVLGQPSYSENLTTIIDEKKNRLVKLKKDILDQASNTPGLVWKYTGGPGSVLGITGETLIKRSTNTRVINQKAFNTTHNSYISYEELEKQDSSGYGPPEYKEDFRKKLKGPGKAVKSLDYTKFNIEQRVNLGDPGKGPSSNRIDYQAGRGKPLDKINALPLYQSEGPITDKIKNDLVKFRIGVIDNNNPKNKTYIHFRAFIDSMSDSYSSTWNTTEFVGRGEQLYRYGGGFNRSVNLAWTVAAQSKEELIPMYQKLNYLASIVAPDYSGNGYMRGNLITLTLGGWFHEQLGFIEGITYDVPQESPWEIGIPSSPNDSDGDGINNDNSVKELPHMIKVTGFKFTPIQSFLPRIQNNTFKEDVFEGAKGNFVSAYGMERYIQLSNGGATTIETEGGKVSIKNDNYGNPSDGSEFGGNRNYLPSNPPTPQPASTITPSGDVNPSITTVTRNIDPNSAEGIAIKEKIRNFRNRRSL